jgi:hypothetical protein
MAKDTLGTYSVYNTSNSRNFTQKKRVLARIMSAKANGLQLG